MERNGIDDAIERALKPSPRQEGYVRRRFWPKVRSSLGRVPFAGRAVAAYYAATDPATPARVKGVLFAALAYFVLPIDLIPDFILGLGYTDDATVLFAALKLLSAHITDTHAQRAEAYFAADP